MIRSGMLVARAHTYSYLSLPPPSWSRTTIYLDNKTGAENEEPSWGFCLRARAQWNEASCQSPVLLQCQGGWGPRSIIGYFLGKAYSLYLTIFCPSSYRRLHSQTCQVSKVASLPTLNMAVHPTQINRLEEASQIEKAHGYCWGKSNRGNRNS